MTNFSPLNSKHFNPYYSIRRIVEEIHSALSFLHEAEQDERFSELTKLLELAKEEALRLSTVLKHE